MKELLVAVIDCLCTIADWPDKDSATGANQLLCSIRQPEFILALFVASKIFSFSLPLCRELQKINIDLVEALNMAVQVESLVKQIRNQADIEFKEIFMSVTAVCVDIGVDIVMPRISKRQTNRCNITAQSAEEYFRAAIFVPFVDNFLMQLHERFLAHKQTLASFMCLLPPKGCGQPNADQTRDLRHLADMYNADINCSTEVAEAELQLWYNHLGLLDKPPANALDAFCACDRDRLPAIKRLLQILATLPVTTATSERSFSTLRRLKTYLRNTTTEDRLNGLAMLNVHRNIEVQPDQIINELCTKPRRLPFQL